MVFLMCLMLLPMGLSARYDPFPIVGVVKGLTVPVDAVITNLRTGVSVTQRTNEFDEFVIDWANTQEFGGTKFQYGDRFKIVIPICEDLPACNSEFTYNGGGYIKTFDLSGVQHVECEECPKCSEPVVCEECQVCKVCPSPDSYCGEIDDICPYVMNAYCEAMKGDFCEECPSQGLLGLIGEILLFIAIPGAGVSVALYKTKTGKVVARVTTHRHKSSGGYRKHPVYRYHDSNPHPRDCWDPVYKNGKYLGCKSGKHDVKAEG